MKKKTVHIISHSHWDREWYMAYEEHHMRLVNLVDDLLDLFKEDPEFDSFHLDGQTIILDDYLQVRPERREEVQAAISAGKLKIGPFYILQDDFLISSESNVRNMLVGRKESERWGAPVELGYFPDTFGNMGQTPQMMKAAGLSAAAFGRGVKPIGFDNQVLEQSEEAYSSQFSEMWWEGPDGTKILGILFANWYSNGNEIPAEKAAALDFWNQKLADVEKFASTSHLLMMNGVDHQPVQKDLSKAIRLANELFPDYEFVHSNWPTYLEAVRSDLPENLSTVTGELTSQETDGWYTLANTASSRVYLKQWNTKVERQLENVTEPLASLAYRVTGEYPHDKLTYAYFDEEFIKAVKNTLNVFKTEQNHEDSPYHFVRDTERHEDTLIRDGKGAKTAYTGMTWSGFRPSDDACEYGYLVPSNMFAVVILDYIKEIFTELLSNEEIANEAKILRDEIQEGLEKFAKTKNQQGEEVWAYDVDGLGNKTLMDDSNVPNLIAAPYLGFCQAEDEVYLKTRQTLLSKENPYYYEGKYARGIGSSHTPEDYVWPIALAMEGMTTNDKSEKERILNHLVETDAGTHLMHEGFDVNNPQNYTREWFSWANMMFCELVMDYFDIQIEK